MISPIEMLMEALNEGGDFDACIETIACGFPAFCQDEGIFIFPDEVFAGILSHPKIEFPTPEESIGFFIRLFERGPKTAHIFFDAIPFDQMSLVTIQQFKRKYEEFGLKREIRILSSFEKLYEKNSILQQQYVETAEQLERSSALIGKMTTLLNNTTSALNAAAKH